MALNLSALVFDRAQEDVEAKNAKGTYNATDINRVESMVRNIQKILVSCGYVSDLATNIGWMKDHVPLKSDMVRYLGNVKALASMIPYALAPVELPESMEKLTYIGANNIEKTLYDLGKAAESIEANWFYSGMIESGVAYL